MFLLDMDNILVTLHHIHYIVQVLSIIIVSILNKPLVLFKLEQMLLGLLFKRF